MASFDPHDPNSFSDGITPQLIAQLSSANPGAVSSVPPGTMQGSTADLESRVGPNAATIAAARAGAGTDQPDQTAQMQGLAASHPRLAQLLEGIAAAMQNYGAVREDPRLLLEREQMSQREPLLQAQTEGTLAETALRLGQLKAMQNQVPVTLPNGQTIYLNPQALANYVRNAAAAGTKLGTPDEQAINYLQSQVNPATGKPYTTFEAYQKLVDLKQGNKPDTAEQNKSAVRAVIGKLDSAGLSTNPADLPKSLNVGLQKGIISRDEHMTVAGYLATNPTPSTNIQVHTTEGAQSAEQKQLGSYYMDPKNPGRIVRGDQLSDTERRSAMPVKDYEKAQASIQHTQTIMDSYEDYRGAFDGKLTPNDTRALQVLTSSDKMDHDLITKATSGVLDALMGEPLTGYSTKAMGGIMTKDQYNALSPAGKKALVGYYNAIISNFADMKERLGSIGRNEIQLLAEIHTIPLPYMDRDTANEMLDAREKSTMRLNPYMRGAQLPTRQAGGGAQHLAGGAAVGLQEGATGTGSDGQKYIVRGGIWQRQ
jgi:hypothetical protein